MMYSDKLVAAIKVNGQILRETGDMVSLPFGSEYSILIKNLNSVRAMAKVTVNGIDATDGTRLIIEPNSSMELERFIRNGNLQAGNRLKFIDRTAEVEGHRGIGEDDGLIRVEGWRELVSPQVVTTTIYNQTYPCFYPPTYPTWPHYPPPSRWVYGGGFTSSLSASCNTVTSATSGPVNRSATGSGGPRPSMRPQSPTGSARRATPTRSAKASDIGATMNCAFYDAGITVPGSESHQQFQSSSGFPLESNSVVIVLRLRGDVGGKPLLHPVTVKMKMQCGTCGKAAKSGVSFCGGCGTALEII